jgi:hypothetical protein
MSQESVEKTLGEYFNDAISNDYLLTVLITSYTRGKIKDSQNLPFGLGKTTLAFWLSWFMNGKNWDMVFERAAYNPYNLATMLKPKSQRKNAVLWDDVQSTAPAEQGVPRAIRRLANFLSTERPEVACVLMTAPNISMISSPIRKLVVFEIIVAKRGLYEVQKITYHKKYRDPLHDIAKLQYIEEIEGTFNKLPDDVMERYKKWRASEKLRLYPSLLAELQTYIQLRDATEEDGQEVLKDILESSVVKSGRDYVLKLPKELGEKLHKQRVSFKRPAPVT